MRNTLFFSALLALSGCGGGQQASGPKTPAPTPLPTAAVEAPAEVIVWGGTDVGLMPFLSQAHGLLTGAGLPLPPIDGLAGPMLADGLWLTNADAFDLSKPVRVAFIESATGIDPMLVMSVRNEAAFAAALPQWKKGNFQGNRYTWTYDEGAEDAYYANLLPSGDAVAVTFQPQHFQTHKGFIEALATAKLPSGLSMTVEIAHVVQLHRAEIEEGLANGKAALRNSPPDLSNPEVSAQMTIAVFDWINESLHEMDRLRFRLSADAAGVQLSMAVTPKANTGLEATYRLLAGTDFNHLDRFPADSPVIIAAQFAPEIYRRFSQSLVQVMGLAEPDPDQTLQAQFKAYFDGLATSTDRQFVMATHPMPGQPGLFNTFISGVTDPVGAQQLKADMIALNQHPAMFKQYEEMGGKVTFTAEAYTVGQTVVSTNDIVLPATGQMGPAGAMLSNLLMSHHAVTDTLWLGTFGRDARPVMEALLNNTLPGGLASAPSPSASLKRAAPNPFFFLWINPIDLARRLHLNGQNPAPGMLAGIEGASGLGWSLGSEAGELHMVFDVPTHLIRDGVQVYQRAGGTL